MNTPKILIIAGPNGAGKTTFAKTFLPGEFETTLSGLSYIKHIKEWQQIGYRINLFFLMLDSVDLAIKRVAERVDQGGHNIPEVVIRRRFKAGLYNFKHYYANLVNSSALYDNSTNVPILLEWGENCGSEKLIEC